MRWAYKKYGLIRSDVEYLLYLHGHCPIFHKKELKHASFDKVWDKRRWLRLYSNNSGWIEVYRERNYTTQKYSLFTLSKKAKLMINTIYRVTDGKQSIPKEDIKRFSKSMSRDERILAKRLEKFNNN